LTSPLTGVYVKLKGLDVSENVESVPPALLDNDKLTSLAPEKLPVIVFVEIPHCWSFAGITTFGLFAQPQAIFTIEEFSQPFAFLTKIV
jgi:hypothetical protein